MTRRGGDKITFEDDENQQELASMLKLKLNRWGSAMKKLFLISVVFLIVTDIAIWKFRHRPRLAKKTSNAVELAAPAAQSPVPSLTHLPEPSAAVPTALAIGPTGEAWIAFMDHLKTCTPFVLNYKFLDWEQGTRKKIIQGKKGNTCVVIDLLPPDLAVSCAMSPESVANLTGEDQYRDAQDGLFNQSVEDASHCHHAFSLR